MSSPTLDGSNGGSVIGDSELSAARRAALADLVESIRQLEGLTEQIGTYRLPPNTCSDAPELVAALCDRLGVPLGFDRPTDDCDHVVDALASGLRWAQRAPTLTGLTPLEIDELVGDAERIVAEDGHRYRSHTIRRPDGTLLRVLEIGPAGGFPIVLSPACAMSNRLCLPWMRALEEHGYRCLVPQTRGTCGEINRRTDFDDRGFDVQDQAEDLMGLIEVLTDRPVHLMCLCGGAAPGLMVAAEQPSYVTSLSLWHADLDLGGESEKTEHQRNLRELLDAAGASRESAAAIRRTLASTPLAGVPRGIGPLVVRPYADDELFYRYAKLTAATMHWDSRQTAMRVHHPTLIVTSRDDHTAHPSGSLRLAEVLTDATLEVTEHGTHLDAFAATPRQVDRLRSFLDVDHGSP